MTTPIVLVQKNRIKRLLEGSPWVYSNEIVMDLPTKSLAKGTLVHLYEEGKQRYLATAIFNPHSLISGRVLCREQNIEINQGFFEKKITEALLLRDELIAHPFYRLIHGETDELPGLIIDRFDDYYVCQFNTAGMELFQNDILNAMKNVLSPKGVILRNDSSSRLLEGLNTYFETAFGEIPNVIPVIENGVTFFTSLLEGQKTGWFYDQRANHRFISNLSKGKTVLDCYCYMGGFGVQAAVQGAQHITFVDRSESAIEKAKYTAEHHNIIEKSDFIHGEAFDIMYRLIDQGKTFDVVIMDPPAFVKNRKDLRAGLKGYAKMAKMAAQLTSKKGYLYAASCSHNVSQEDFDQAITKGVHEAKRYGRIIHSGGADIDHPIHPNLPETGYLKSITLRLD